MSGDDYCELCDLRLSECHHGRPEPTPPPPAPKVSTPRVRKTTAAPAKTPRARASEPTITTRATQRKWTSSEEMEPVIVAILEEAGGELDNAAVLSSILERMQEYFRPGDTGKTPTGELRWQLAARKARQSLINQGVMVRERPGTWKLA